MRIMSAPRKYPPELRERAMRLVPETRKEDPELWPNAAVTRELKRANEILLAVSSFFARELDPRVPW
jgi:transposase